jgi:ribonucleoside-triphosphate reductase
VAEKIKLNGEPGLCWLENMRAYGRMGDAPNYKDSHEMCCLVETFPFNHQNYQDF